MLYNKLYFSILTVIDCGAPFSPSGVIIDPFNNTKFGALITFHCVEINDSITAECGTDGEWEPDLISYNCEKGIYCERGFIYYVVFSNHSSKLIDCGAPVAVSGVIIEDFTNANFGTVIRYHCKESETLFMAICGSDGEWEPDPALLKCENTIPGRLPRRNHI